MLPSIDTRCHSGVPFDWTLLNVTDNVEDEFLPEKRKKLKLNKSSEQKVLVH